MKLTKNFSKSEFECHCGCEMPSKVLENVKELAKSLQIIRDRINKPIFINSAYRCKEHNKLIGGVEHSQHILGKAADIVIKGQNPYDTYDFIDNLMEDRVLALGGLGNYDTFTHFDIRGYYARW